MPKKLNLINQKFGKLTVIESAPNKGKRTQWKCLCDCGNEIVVLTSSLTSQRTQSCGCLRKENLTKLNKSRIIDLTNQRFGKLTVIKQSESYRDHSAWLCQCDCGNLKIVNSVELKKGDTLSCGCLKSSYGEIRIENILKENNIIFEKEYIFTDLVSENNIPLRFDFAIFNNDKTLSHLIEYDGEQHYLEKTNNFWKKDTLQNRQIKDKLKDDYCLLNNIPLIRIPYWEKNNITIEKLILK